MLTILNIINPLIVPVTFISRFLALFSLGWLAVLGELQVIGIGLLAIIGGAVLISALMGIGLLFDHPFIKATENGKAVQGFFFGFLTIAYTQFVIIAWSVIVFDYSVNIANTETILPILLFYSNVAIIPFAFLASKDLSQGNNNASVTVLFLRFAYLIAIGYVLVGQYNIVNIIIIFAVTLAFCSLFQIGLAAKLTAIKQRS